MDCKESHRLRSKSKVSILISLYIEMSDEKKMNEISMKV